MELVTPSQALEQSYRDYIVELGAEERYPFPLDFDHQDFPALLARLDDFAKGMNLPAGFVPSSTLWLVDKGEILGVTNIRHTLNDAIAHCGGHIGLSIRPSKRGLGLGKVLMAKSIAFLQQRQVNEVHIHCYKDNQASGRTIISCGGRLDSEIEVGDKCVQRYVVRR
ncbi:GNAT family N-acetyltransferase [Pseudoalteromonas sp. T1lg75]|uniref:GNAT family N-acetyltransferase n=1 Tax=Pseudoalteromonas sp. T1lg75 TaxID=2077102 RepID=UPI000CF72EBC|nr:GNAT family N-acetyltransferase [Pseudoalteromonas sp. T1lg75]